MEHAHAALSEFTAILVGEHDRNHREILAVYADQDGRYVVYQTSERVIILYAEDPLAQRAQRKRLAPLATLRSQIDGDLVEWRSADPRFSRLPQTARAYDMRVASALIEALEGDADAGLAILQQVRADIVGEKASRARLSYLLWTIATAVAFILVDIAVYRTTYSARVFVTNQADAQSILHAMVAGVLGAFYSMALGIERRQIRDDQRRLDHITDALVRISIGVLAAFILETFLLSGTVQIGFANGASLAAGASDSAGIHHTTWPIELIAGFLAGFAERLVPDLLNSYEIQKKEPDPVPVKAVPTGGAGVANPASAGAMPAGAAEPDAETATAPSEEEDVDGCVIGHTDDSTATPDNMLPAASGGVARE